MIEFVCACNRRLSVPRQLGGKRIQCTRCNRAITVPQAAGQPRKRSQPTPSLPMPATDEPQQEIEKDDDNRNVIAGVLAGLVVIVLLILMWLLWPRTIPDLAGTVPTATLPATTPGGEETEQATAAVSGLEAVTEEKPQAAPAVDEVAETAEEVEDSALVDEEEVGASAEEEVKPIPELQTGSVPETESEEETELTKTPSRGGTRKTISGLTQSTVAGVKVYGSIALVCDVSGSMLQDLPSLIQELHEKFPADTPVILVPGCSFLRPTGTTPIKSTHGTRGRFAGYQFQGMKTYSCRSTTDAILFAATELQRDTVMFNSDLQDGGSEQAVNAFRRAYEERPFRLSGRSLERDAPDRLLEFIRDSGGDFVVDPIYRKKQPAMHWAK